MAAKEDEAGKEFKANLESLLREECLVDKKSRCKLYFVISVVVSMEIVEYVDYIIEWNGWHVENRS